jgi:predicted RNA-binding Zn ribbon-like protein
MPSQMTRFRLSDILVQMVDPARPTRRWTSAVAPAPGDLRIVQDFINTIDIDLGTDVFESRAGLENWLADWNLAGSKSKVSETQRRQALDLREGLRALLVFHGEGKSSAAALRDLAGVLKQFTLHCRLQPEGGFELISKATGWPRAAARLLTLVTQAIGNGSWKRLKACRRDDCRWVFFDASKNRSGKWCAMAGCGDLMKARAYRKRLRQRTHNSD